MEFAAIVANYQLLPDALVNPVARVLPWVEVVCGAALVAGFGPGGRPLCCAGCWSSSWALWLQRHARAVGAVRLLQRGAPGRGLHAGGHDPRRGDPGRGAGGLRPRRVGGAQAPGLGALLGGVLASRRAVHGHGRDVDRRRRGDLWGGFPERFPPGLRARGRAKPRARRSTPPPTRPPPRRPFRCSRRPRPLRPWRWKPSRKPWPTGRIRTGPPGGGRPRRARAARGCLRPKPLRPPGARCPWRPGSTGAAANDEDDEDARKF